MVKPVPSMMRASDGALTFAPTAAIRPLRITTVPRSSVAPETVTIRALVIAYVSIALRCAPARETKMMIVAKVIVRATVSGRTLGIGTKSQLVFVCENRKERLKLSVRMAGMGSGDAFWYQKPTNEVGGAFRLYLQRYRSGMKYHQLRWWVSDTADLGQQATGSRFGFCCRSRWRSRLRYPPEHATGSAPISHLQPTSPLVRRAFFAPLSQLCPSVSPRRYQRP